MARPKKEDLEENTEVTVSKFEKEVVVFDIADGNTVKLVTEREARSPRYKPV